MSDFSDSPAFDELADTFWRLGVMQSPSQLHGWLSGQLAVGVPLEAGQWLQLSREYLDPVDDFSEPDCALLLELHNSACSQIAGEGFEFKLLLPDDMVDIRQRVESLSQWCHGFLAGFAYAGKVLQSQRGQQQYSKEISETLGDMAAISQAALEGEADMESSEQDYFQVSEYLRLATVNIYLECSEKLSTANSDDKSERTSDNDNRTLH